MVHALVSLAAAALTAATLIAQDAPGVYHTQFENDWVRLVRVRYAANSKVPAHGHPTSVTTYIYLSGSSPVRFTHEGTRTHVVTRQPTTAGAFRVSRGGDERHAVENLGPVASDFLRVEFKTDPAGQSSPYHRDSRPLGPATTTRLDERFANAQMRITRIALAPGSSETEIVTPAAAPALLVALADGVVAVDGTRTTLTNGQERWVAGGRRERIANTGSAPLELLRIDFLTPPRR